jgi:hypothetical protein
MYGYLDLVRYDSIKWNFIIMATNYFIGAFVYYVVTLSLSEYSGDPVTNAVIMGSCEAIAVIAAIILLEKCSRRFCYLFSFALSVVGCGVAIVFKYWSDDDMT